MRNMKWCEMVDLRRVAVFLSIGSPPYTVIMSPAAKSVLAKSPRPGVYSSVTLVMCDFRISTLPFDSVPHVDHLALSMEGALPHMRNFATCFGKRISPWGVDDLVSIRAAIYYIRTKINSRVRCGWKEHRWWHRVSGLSACVCLVCIANLTESVENKKMSVSVWRCGVVRANHAMSCDRNVNLSCFPC